jgi:hypothetical protein
MGGSSSKTVVKQLSESITNICMTTVQTCESAATQDQSIEVNNTGFKLWGTYRLEQKTDIKSECFSDVQKQAELQNKLIQTIAQSTTATGVALISAFGSSSSSAETNLTNIVRSNVTMSNIQKSYNIIKQNQSAKFSNSGVIVFEQAELTQGSKIFAAAALQEIDKAGIFNTIETHIDQTSSADTSSPISLFGSLFSGLGSNLSTIFMFVIVIAIAILGGPYIMELFKSKGVDEVPPADVTAATTADTVQ